MAEFPAFQRTSTLSPFDYGAILGKCRRHIHLMHFKGMNLQPFLNAAVYLDSSERRFVLALPKAAADCFDVPEAVPFPPPGEILQTVT